MWNEEWVYSYEKQDPVVTADTGRGKDETIDAVSNQEGDSTMKLEACVSGLRRRRERWINGILKFI